MLYHLSHQGRPLAVFFPNLLNEHIFPFSTGIASAASGDLLAWQPAPHSTGTKPGLSRASSAAASPDLLSRFPSHHSGSSFPPAASAVCDSDTPSSPPAAPQPARRARQRVTAASAGASRLHRPSALQTPASHWPPPLPLTRHPSRQLAPGRRSSSSASPRVPPPSPGHLSLSQINK
ncbi:actin nucleation-promoting factor WASL-like [Bubalus kerabau]|uniref:actin nucleation-promoting factor WASL-like n=1 Tax=Bubalus carabanensis TaxID=3119969 RepID=UPI00244EE68B|nr:actin nucleation-promoting factor WASL-like [Bubalus carabanensis]